MINRKQIRREIVHELMWKHKRTRKELGETLQVRQATLCDILQELATSKVVVEPERRGIKTGRRASPIALNPDFGCFLGLDAHAEHSSAILINGEGAVVASARQQSLEGKVMPEVMEEVWCRVHEIQQDAGDSWKQLRGVGISFPGLINSKTGKLVHATHLKGSDNYDLAGWVSEKFGLPASVLTNTASRLYAERHRAPTIRPQSWFHMELGVGVGGGYVRDDEVFEGESGCSMEIGHVVVTENGARCQCGNRGCLEAVAGLYAVKRRIEELTAQGVTTDLGRRPFSMEHFRDCVTEGDKMALMLLGELGHHLAVALSIVVNLLNPGRIILSGPLTRLGDPLVQRIEQELAVSSLPSALAGLEEMVISDLGEDSSALGAALQARDNALMAVE